MRVYVRVYVMWLKEHARSSSAQHTKHVRMTRFVYMSNLCTRMYFTLCNVNIGGRLAHMQPRALVYDYGNELQHNCVFFSANEEKHTLTQAQRHDLSTCMLRWRHARALEACTCVGGMHIKDIEIVM
jgi:hypothetical protein